VRGRGEKGGGRGRRKRRYEAKLSSDLEGIEVEDGNIRLVGKRRWDA